MPDTNRNPIAIVSIVRLIWMPFSFVLVGAPNPAEPFHQLLQLLVRELSPSFSHIHQCDPPGVSRLSNLIYALQPMALCACPVEQPESFGIGKERGDLRGNVSSGKRFRAGSELGY